jgi:hypothetical protein
MMQVFMMQDDSNRSSGAVSRVCHDRKKPEEIQESVLSERHV